MKKLLTSICLMLPGMLVLQAQNTTVTAKQKDLITTDAAPTGKANPGDVIRYQTDIQNTGVNQANGVNFNAVPDARTTFQAGSFHSSPLAFADGPYAVTGNVPISISAAAGLKANDFDDAPAGLTVTAGTFATVHGSITIAADGSFTYTPAAGYTGPDSYNYTLNDGNPDAGITATDMGTVSFTVSNLIWFVDNTGGGSGGDGRLNTPFKTLTDFANGAIAAADVIYIEHTGTNYTGPLGIVLKNNEQLFGEGHTGGANLADVLPFTLAPNSVALPAINGSRPVVSTVAGAAIRLASGNTIRGLDVGNSPTFAIDDNGNVGTLTVSEVSINNTTGGGWRTDNGGTLAVTLGALTSTGGANGVYVSATGGSFAVSGATSITNSTGSGLLIDGTSAGATANFAAITVGNTGSHAIQIINNTGTFTATGLTTINSPAVGSNISLNISGGSGAITFAGLDVNGRRDKGIRISSGSRNITTGALDIDNPNAVTGIGLEILSPTGGTIDFGATTINNGNAAGSAVEIQNSAAAVTFAAGSAISNSASHEFFVNQGNGNITYNGSISSTAGACLAVNSRTGGTTSFTGNISSSGAATAISVANNTGGTINFSGTSKSISSSTAAAVSLATNTGATINFTGGGLALTTTSGAGFTATAGGTVTVQGSNNTISSGTGTALNVANTTIGGSGMTFKSISANGSANGIALNSTGTSGSLTVTGDGNTTVGGNNSGGTIQNTSGVGISLTTTMSPSFTNVRIMNTTGHGVGGTDVTNFTFNYGNIDGSNADALSTSEEANIGFYVNETNSTRNNLDGVVSIIGNQLTNAFFHGIDIFNFSGTISDADISNNTITSSTSSASSKGSGIRLIGFGSPTTIASINKATIDQNTITNFPSGTGIQVQGGNGANNGSGGPHPTSPAGTYGSNAANPIAITDNVLNGGASKFGAFGMAAVVNGKGSGYYSISGNTVSNSIGTGIAISSFGFATVTAILTSNTITPNNLVGAQGIGAGTSQTWANTDNPTLNVRIGDGTAGGSNNISQTDGNGILVTARDCSSKVNARILMNTVAAPLSGNRNGIRVDAANAISLDDEINLEISGNTCAGSGVSPEGIGLRKQGTTTTTNDFKVVGMSATGTTGVETYVGGLNPNSALNPGTGLRVLLISATSGFSMGTAMSF